MNLISSEFKNAGFIYDRLPSDSFNLPYSLQDIKIQPNELAVASTFNLKFRKLYDNFLYLYGLCFMSNFNFKDSLQGYYDERFGFIPKSLDTDYYDFILATTGLTPALSTSNKAISFYNKETPNVINTVFATTSSVGIFTLERVIEDVTYLDQPLILILTDGLTPGSNEYNTVVQNIERKRSLITSYVGGVKFVQNSIDPLSGTILFKKIESLLENNNLLYITDSVYNNVYSYDVEEAAGNDNIRKNILFQQNILGGSGTIEEKTKFNAPTLTVNVDGYLLVVDSKNNCFKVYDSNFNWVATSTQSVFFKKYPNLNSIVYHKDSRQVLIATDKALHTFYVESISQINFVKTYDIYFQFPFKERIIDLKLANYSSDILYVLTTSSILKKWITKLDKNIAYLLSPRAGLDNYFWTVLSPISEDKDIQLIRASSFNPVLPSPRQEEGGFINPVASLSGLSALSAYNPGYYNSYVLIFEEGLNLQSLLKDNDFDVYSKEEVCLNKNEYNCSWTYNKCFKKLLYNINLLTSKIVYRFYTREAQDTSTTQFIFKTYNNLLLDRVIKDTNTFTNIFVNENFQSETINRCFKQIYDYQKYIMDNLTNNTPINLDLTPYKPPFRTQ